MNHWLMANRSRLYRWMSVCLAGGVLMMGAGSLDEGKIDWKHAKLMHVVQADAALDEDGKGFYLQVADGRYIRFFCLNGLPFCQVLSDFGKQNGAKPMKADVEYLFVPERGAVMLSAAYRDLRTGEPVNMRYDQARVDSQAEQVEQFWVRQRRKPVQPRALRLRKPFEPHGTTGLQVGPRPTGGQVVRGAQQFMPRRASRDLQCRPRFQTEALEDLQRQCVRQRHQRRMGVLRQHGLQRHGAMRGESAQQRLAERRAQFG